MNDAEGRRLSSEDRREQILDVASVVFGERGYVGGTTDVIAREAGISQAYVVRMFGTKENLYRAVAERAADRVVATFRETAASFPPDLPAPARQGMLGVAYTRLIADRGTLMTLQHLFTMGHHPVLGPIARERFLETFRVVRDEAGLSPEDAMAFYARGMLINVLMGLRLPDAVDTDALALELVESTFGAKYAEIAELSCQPDPIADAVRS